MPHLSWNEVRDRAIRFTREHAGDRSESAEKQTFWNDFFAVFGLRRASLASFEENVRNLKGNKGSIDLLWKGRLLVEHKSFGEDLALAGTQAFTYIEDLTRENRWEEIPRYVLVSDFARFVLYDLEPEEQRDLPLFEGRKIAPHHFTLSEFHRSVRHFAFMLGQTRVRLDPEDPANEKAYARMCELHDALKAGGFDIHDLERLLVRVLFCLFAEDNGLFPPDSFTQFIRARTREDGADSGQHLNHLFELLDTPIDQRQSGLDDDLAAFPYVNGLLFRERLRTPVFTRDMRNALLFCCDFQWAKISPAVFGSLFQGVLEDRARRQQGAHYTSERDIMKILRSLFLDELRAEWTRLLADRSTRRRAAMESFHEKLCGLRFLDPACGCGNFLVLAYRELRTLEIELLRELTTGGEQRVLDVRQLLKVDVDQFHGIEYSEWPVRIAEVALWLMDHQMNAQAAEIFGQSFDRLPLRASPHIVQANALRIDWNEVLPCEQCSYVLGNPPYAGKKEQNAEQKADMELTWGEVKGAGVLDYVTAWYLKAARYIQGTRVPVAFVSTNSITQGEQVSVLWGELFQRWHLKIHFAHRTFPWMSEARGKAHVHVVIIGFAVVNSSRKRIYDYEQGENEVAVTEVANISPYLTDAADVVIAKRATALDDVPPMVFGTKLVDNGYFVLNARERADLIASCPSMAPHIRKFTGGEEFINGSERWVLWLENASPADIRNCPAALERIERVRVFRAASKKLPTVALAATPSAVGENRQPSSDYLLFPKVSSERRPYVPLGFLPQATVANGSSLVVPNATHFHFGILSSRMHMAWMRLVCGRMKSDYQYSVTIVYNNFPWPIPTPEQRARVETHARSVLAARESHLPPRGMSTLADLYDPLTTPAALAKAHADLDKTVEKCYRPEPFHSDRERVEHLFRIYEARTAPLLPATPRTRSRRGATRPPAKPRVRARTPNLPAADSEQPGSN